MTESNTHPSTAGILPILLAVSFVSGAAAQSPPLVDAVRGGDRDTVSTLLRQPGIDVNAAQADGMTALHWAAHLDALEAARLLLRAGADVNAANAFGVTPLRLAATNGSAAMLEVLLAAGADPDAAIGDGETALMTVARTGNVDAMRVLLEHGADVDAALQGGQTALMWAAGEGHAAAVRALIAAGGDVGARTDAEVPRSFRRTPIGGFTALLFAARAGHVDVVRTLLESGADLHDELPDGTGALILAATNAHYELGLFLVDQGIDPNQGVADDTEIGYTALHAISWVRKPPYGYNPPGPVNRGSVEDLDFVRQMVARGADVNARMIEDPNTRFRKGYSWIGATPLLMAAKVADAPLVRVLLELGADPTLTTEESTTLLMVAAGVGIASPGEDGGTEAEAFECMQVVLGLGGDINAVDDNGETALHGAVYRLAPSVVELVLEHGADTFTLVNLSGWTPLHIADGVFRQGTYKESPQIAEMLRAAMRERGLPTTLAELQARSTGGAGGELALTVWEGVYSAEQAARGGEVYRQRCRKCHRRDLSGDGALQGDGSEVVPSLVGFSFEQRWDGVTVADMFLTVSRAMPWDAPGTVSPQQNIDVVSYLLEMNGIPAGAAELPADTERLDRIGITAQPPG